jgi:hypothetical protein
VLVLLVASVSKLAAIAMDPFADHWTGTPLPLLFMAAVLELFVVVVCFRLRNSPVVWLLLSCVFSLYLAISVAWWISGQTRIGCFGLFSVPVWGCVLINVIALATLLLPLRHSSASLSQVWRDALLSLSDRNPKELGVLTSALMVVLVCGLFLSRTVRAQADRLLNGAVVMPVLVDLGNVPVGTTIKTRIPLRNLSQQPIEIVGVQSSCSCVATPDDKRSLPPESTETFQVQVALGTPGRFHQRVYYFLDHPLQQRVAVDILADVRK